MPKFIVISYDNDQQQTFFDHIVAKDEDAAKVAIEAIRSDAIACAALTAAEMHEMADSLDETPDQVIKAGLRELNHGLNPRD